MRRRLSLLALLAAGCIQYEFTAVDVDPEEITECDFTAYDDLPELSVYECNPVFTTTGESWAANLGQLAFGETLVLGHPFFQLWYVGWDEDYDAWSVGNAVSENGTDWLPHPENPSWPERDDGDWDAGSIQGLSVDWDPNLGGYTMLYGGISPAQDFFGVGIAGSRNGSEWALSPANPVLSLGLPYDGINYAWPLDLTIREGSYDAYFGGETDGETIDVFRLQTDDAEDWNRAPERIFEAGEADAWDGQGVVQASVVDFNGVLYMFYVGFAQWQTSGSVRYTDQSHLGLAKSVDAGATWTRAFDAPLPLSNTTHGDITLVAARKIGSRIHLWVGDLYPDLDTNAVGYFLYTPEP
jgi:hypothetical protein